MFYQKKIPDVVQPITNPNTLPTFKKLLRGDVDLTSKNVLEVFGNKDFMTSSTMELVRAH